MSEFVRDHFFVATYEHMSSNATPTLGLLTLRLLPLTYDREIRDLVFIYNCTLRIYRLKHRSICYFCLAWPVSYSEPYACAKPCLL